MNETKAMVKTVLGFLLVVVILIGGMFGFDVKVDITDQNAETTVAEDDVLLPTETQKDVEGKEQSTSQTSSDKIPCETIADSTPVVEETTDVDNSVDTEVTEPTEEETNVTEGEDENA